MGEEEIAKQDSFKTDMAVLAPFKHKLENGNQIFNKWELPEAKLDQRKYRSLLDNTVSLRTFQLFYIFSILGFIILVTLTATANLLMGKTLEKNHDYFAITRDFIAMDISYRTQIMDSGISNSIVFFILCRPQIPYAASGRPDLAKRAEEISINYYNNLFSLFQEVDFMEFFVTNTIEIREDFQKKLKNFINLELHEAQDAPLKEIWYRKRNPDDFRNDSYSPIQKDLTPIQFFNYFNTKLDISIPLAKSVRESMKKYKPPFHDLPPDLIASYYFYAEVTLDLTLFSLDYRMTDFSARVGEVAKFTTDPKNNPFRVMYQLTFYSFICFSLFFFASAVFLACRLSRALSQLLSKYSLLTMGELSFYDELYHLLGYQLKDNYSDEKYLISVFFRKQLSSDLSEQKFSSGLERALRITKDYSKERKSKAQEIASVRDIENPKNDVSTTPQILKEDRIIMTRKRATNIDKKNKKKIFSNVSIKYPTTKSDMVFRSAWVIVVANIILFCLLSVISVGQFTLQYHSLKEVKIRKLLTAHYNKFVSVNTNFLAFLNMMTFGNFMRIDGKYIEEVFDDNAVSHLLSDKLLEDLKGIMSPQNLESLKDLQYNSLCDRFPNETVFQRQERILCNSFSLSRKGVFSFLQGEHNRIELKRAEFLVREREYLDFTKIQLGFAPMIPYLSSIFFLKNAFVHKSASTFYVSKLLEILESEGERYFQKINLSMQVLLFSVWSSFYLILLIYAYILNKNYKKDYQVSLETVHSLEPRTVAKHFPIFKAILKTSE